jgi:DNA-binding SARP family transcriptional activator
VLRNGSAVPPAAWQSRKARDLLKFLIARRGRATPRELLAEALWPGDDPDRLGNRLSVALSTLRSVLDPERQFGQDTFVRTDRESVLLDLDTVLVDVEVLLREAPEALVLRATGRSDEARERLEYVASLYTGDFLEEDPYSDWAVSLREEGRATYVAVARALAEDAAVAGDTDAAASHFLRILGQDGYDESAHLGLVRALDAGGRRGEARRAYRAYVGRMEEVGATPSAFPA